MSAALSKILAEELADLPSFQTEDMKELDFYGDVQTERDNIIAECFAPVERVIDF